MICSYIGSPTVRSRGSTPGLNLPLYPYHLSQWWPPGQYKVNTPWIRNGLHSLSLTEAHAGVNFVDLSSNRSLITSQLCVQGPTYSYTISSSFSSNSRNASLPDILFMSVTIYRHFEGIQSNQGKKIRSKNFTHPNEYKYIMHYVFFFLSFECVRFKLKVWLWSLV